MIWDHSWSISSQEMSFYKMIRKNNFHTYEEHKYLEFVCFPHASGVSSWYSSFHPQFKYMHCRIISVSKLFVVGKWLSLCAVVPCDGLPYPGVSKVPWVRLQVSSNFLSESFPDNIPQYFTNHHFPVIFPYFHKLLWLQLTVLSFSACLPFSVLPVLLITEKNIH